MSTPPLIKIIRCGNLILIALTMAITRYGLLIPGLKKINPNTASQLSNLEFVLLVCSTLLIAAAGYIINDYFDVKTDRINKPEKVVIDHGLNRRLAMLIHIQFNLAGLFLGVYVAHCAGHIFLGLIPFSAINLLWFYSTHFKRQLISGNIVVSLLTAFIPIQVLLFDPIISLHAEDLMFLIETIFFLSVFAFLLSLAREIIKDMEDLEGDRETKCMTIPVRWGLPTAKAIVIGIVTHVLLLISITLFYLQKMQLYILIAYLILLVLLPTFFLIYKVYKAQSKREFYVVSQFLKFIMAAGVVGVILMHYKPVF